MVPQDRTVQLPDPDPRTATPQSVQLVQQVVRRVRLSQESVLPAVPEVSAAVPPDVPGPEQVRAEVQHPALPASEGEPHRLYAPERVQAAGYVQVHAEEQHAEFQVHAVPGLCVQVSAVQDGGTTTYTHAHTHTSTHRHTPTHTHPLPLVHHPDTRPLRVLHQLVYNDLVDPVVHPCAGIGDECRDRRIDGRHGFVKRIRIRGRELGFPDA